MNPLPIDPRQLPEARIRHQVTHRLRIQIVSRKGDARYFAKGVKSLSRMGNFTHLSANPLTGSILIVHPKLDAAAIGTYAAERGLFRLEVEKTAPLPLMQRLVGPVSVLDRSIHTVTKGYVDLPGAVFIGLLGTGIYQLIRGRLTAPPWYTALWYAFGLVSMSLIEKHAFAKDGPISSPDTVIQF